MKLLIYSFEKFLNLKTNPAYEVAKGICERYNSNDVDLLQLPVTYNCWEMLRRKVEECNPAFVLGIGVIIGIPMLRVEKVGLNYKHAETPDADGKKASLEKICESAALSYETDVDVLAFVTSLRTKEIPSDISFHAGTYVCNYAYYSCLRHFSNKNSQALFIHVPMSPQEAIELHMPVPTFPPSLIANSIFEALQELQL